MGDERLENWFQFVPADLEDDASASEISLYQDKNGELFVVKLS